MARSSESSARWPPNVLLTPRNSSAGGWATAVGSGVVGSWPFVVATTVTAHPSTITDRTFPAIMAPAALTLPSVRCTFWLLCRLPVSGGTHLIGLAVSTGPTKTDENEMNRSGRHRPQPGIPQVALDASTGTLHDTTTLPAC